MNPKVSIVITTHDRGMSNTFFIDRSIKSCLKQTYKNLEIVVVIDGETSIYSKKIKENYKYVENLSIISNMRRLGGSFSRNNGIAHCSGEFIALLDDDDEYLPYKIESQLEFMRNNSDFDISFTSVIYEGKNNIQPNTAYDGKEDITEYLFGKVNGKVKGFIQTSTIMARKEVFLKVPFKNGLKKHQDWDWIINVTNNFNYKLSHYVRPLSIYHNDSPINTRVGSSENWKFSYNFLQDRNILFTKKSYEYFMYGVVFPEIAALINIKRLNRSSLILEIKKKNGVKVNNLENLLSFIRTIATIIINRRVI